MKPLRHLLCLFAATVLTSTVQAQDSLRPTPKDAAHAVLTMMDMPQLIEQASIKLGTCVEPVKVGHAGQIACTVLVSIGAGSSETQADFYREQGDWIAQPSESQDKLPFPDPALNQ